MNTLLTLFIATLAISSMTYLYLHKKTRISLKFLYIDNIIVILIACSFLFIVGKFLPIGYNWVLYLISPVLVLGFAFGLTMIRFWRTPNRKIRALDNELVSPADGNILYIKKIEKGEVPVSIKRGLKASIDEITQTNLLDAPCWLIGINMTPFDVHKNCSPIAGEVILNKHIDGKFLSLKEPDALLKNERNTLVVKNKKMTVGIVQTASKLVRRIDSYVSVGENLVKGQWFGMIRFGSQVDLIIPSDCTVNVTVGDQIYAKKTIIATAQEAN